MKSKDNVPIMAQIWSWSTRIERAERQDYDFCYFILLFFFPLFWEGREKGNEEK